MFGATTGAGGLADWYEIAGIVIAVPVALAVVWALIRAIGHLKGVHEAIIGKPATPYSDAVPGIIDRFHVVDDHLKTIDLHLVEQDAVLTTLKNEVTFNGGQSVKDRIVRLDKKIDSLKDGQAAAAVTAKQVAQTTLDVAEELHRSGP